MPIKKDELGGNGRQRAPRRGEANALGLHSGHVVA